MHAKNILSFSFLKVSRKTKISFNRILLNLFLKLNTFVEVKKVKVRKNTFWVPFPIKFKRRVYLMLKWILLAVKKNKKKIPIKSKLAFEIINIIKSRRSTALKLRKDNLFQAFRNRSNSHYRW